MKYNQFKYLYPPRPEQKTAPQFLSAYDTGEYVAQCKYNGSACMVFTNGEELHVYNRHKEPLSKYSPAIDFKGLSHTGNWFVFCGEYLNKSKIGETGIKEADKYIIWDVLVWDGVYLIGSTLEYRLSLISARFPCQSRVSAAGDIEMYNYLCCTDLNGIYTAPSFADNFALLYEQLVKVDLYEGVVLKKIKAKLGFGFNELNNTEWQLKSRKETKIYRH